MDSEIQPRTDKVRIKYIVSTAKLKSYLEPDAKVDFYLFGMDLSKHSNLRNFNVLLAAPASCGIAGHFCH